MSSRSSCGAERLLVWHHDLYEGLGWFHLLFILHVLFHSVNSSFSGVGLVGVFVIAANKLVIDISHNSSMACSVVAFPVCLFIGSFSVEGVAESFASERSSASDCCDVVHVALKICYSLYKNATLIVTC